MIFIPIFKILKEGFSYFSNLREQIMNSNLDISYDMPIFDLIIFN